MVGHLEEQITIMLPIATATKVKKDSYIFVPGLSITVHCLLLLKCSYLDCRQQATSDDKLTSDLQPPPVPPKSESLPRVSGLDGELMGAVHTLVRCSLRRNVMMHPRL